MESLCQRFPHVIELVLDNLNDKSLVNCREASREMFESLPKGRFYWIKIIKHYSATFGSFEDSWRQVIYKTSVEIIKELAVEVQQSFAVHNDLDDLLPNDLNIHRRKAPLHIAAERGNLKLCEHILEKTEDKNPSGYMNLIYESTPLHIAAKKGHFTIYSLIMGHIDVNEFEVDPLRNPCYNTPLHLAAINGHFKTFKVIMDWVKEKNPADIFGETPLHLAAKYNHLEICKLIISNVGNIHPQDEHERTPKDYALSANNMEIVTLFESEIFKIDAF